MINALIVWHDEKDILIYTNRGMDDSPQESLDEGLDDGMDEGVDEGVMRVWMKVSLGITKYDGRSTLRGEQQ